MTVAAIIKRSASPFFTVTEDDTLQTVSNRITEHHCSALVVLDAQGQLAGIISEQDLVHAIPTATKASGPLTARDIMTREVHSCSLRDTELQVITSMIEKQIRHMPVVKDGKVLALLDMPEVVKYRLWKIGRLEGAKQTDDFSSEPPDSISPHTRNLPRELRRKHIIEAARSVIIRDGMKGFTVRNITKEAGLSQGMITVHFGSIDELLHAVFDSVMFELPETRGKEPENLMMAIINLRLVVKRYFDPEYFSRNSMLVWLPLFDEMLRNEAFRVKIFARDEDYVREFASHIGKVIEFRKLDVDAVTVSRNLMSFMDGLWLRWCHSARTDTTPERLAALDYLEGKVGSLNID